MSQDSRNDELVPLRIDDFKPLGRCYVDWFEKNHQRPVTWLFCAGYASLYVDPLSSRKQIQLKLEVFDTIDVSRDPQMIISAHLDEGAVLQLCNQLRGMVIEHVRLRRDRLAPTPKT